MTVVTARQALHGLLVYIKTYGKKILGGGIPPSTTLILHPPLKMQIWHPPSGILVRAHLWLQ